MSLTVCSTGVLYLYRNPDQIIYCKYLGDIQIRKFTT